MVTEAEREYERLSCRPNHDAATTRTTGGDPDSVEHAGHRVAKGAVRISSGLCCAEERNAGVDGRHGYCEGDEASQRGAGVLRVRQHTGKPRAFRYAVL